MKQSPQSTQLLAGYDDGDGDDCDDEADANEDDCDLNGVML